LSGDPALYVNLIEPAGFRAREHSESFRTRRKQVEKQFIEEFSRDYCFPDGTIDWNLLLKFNSGNL